MCGSFTIGCNVWLNKAIIIPYWVLVCSTLHNIEAYLFLRQMWFIDCSCTYTIGINKTTSISTDDIYKLPQTSGLMNTCLLNVVS